MLTASPPSPPPSPSPPLSQRTQTRATQVYKSTTQASSAVDHARNAVEKQTATATVAVAACASAEAAAGVSQHSLRAASPKLARQLEKAKVATKAALEEAAELRKQVAIRDAKIADLAASASEAAAQAAESREETRATEEVLKNAWRAVDTLEARRTQLQSSLDAAEEALAASKDAPARNKDTYVRRLVGRLAFGAVWAAGVFLLHSGAKRADKLRRMPKALVPKALWPRYR